LSRAHNPLSQKAVSKGLGAHVKSSEVGKLPQETGKSNGCKAEARHRHYFEYHRQTPLISELDFADSPETGEKHVTRSGYRPSTSKTGSLAETRFFAVGTLCIPNQ
jgi:hypothetical protein